MKAVISMKSKSFQKEIDSNMLYGKKIGEKVQGSPLGLENYELQITGGSDRQGFPMRKGVTGIIRKKLILSGGVGYKPKGKGIRRRKSIRGETVSEEIAQINLKVLKEGKQKFDDFVKKEEPAEKLPEEKLEETKKPEKKDKKEESSKEEKL
jgi:small subunit ribosomal protein S6e